MPPKKQADNKGSDAVVRVSARLAAKTVDQAKIGSDSEDDSNPYSYEKSKKRAVLALLRGGKEADEADDESSIDNDNNNSKKGRKNAAAAAVEVPPPVAVAVAAPTEAVPAKKGGRGRKKAETTTTTETETPAATTTTTTTTTEAAPGKKGGRGRKKAETTTEATTTTATTTTTTTTTEAVPAKKGRGRKKTETTTTTTTTEAAPGKKGGRGRKKAETTTTTAVVTPTVPETVATSKRGRKLKPKPKQEEVDDDDEDDEEEEEAVVEATPAKKPRKNAKAEAKSTGAAAAATKEEKEESSSSEDEPENERLYKGNRICQSTAVDNYMLSPDTLKMSLHYDCARNPHYRSAAPMLLFDEWDVRQLAIRTHGSMKALRKLQRQAAEKRILRQERMASNAIKREEFMSERQEWIKKNVEPGAPNIVSKMHRYAREYSCTSAISMPPKLAKQLQAWADATRKFKAKIDEVGSDRLTAELRDWMESAVEQDDLDVAEVVNQVLAIREQFVQHPAFPLFYTLQTKQQLASREITPSNVQSIQLDAVVAAVVAREESKALRARFMESDAIRNATRYTGRWEANEFANANITADNYITVKVNELANRYSLANPPRPPQHQHQRAMYNHYNFNINRW